MASLLLFTLSIFSKSNVIDQEKNHNNNTKLLSTNFFPEKQSSRETDGKHSFIQSRKNAFLVLQLIPCLCLFSGSARFLLLLTLCFWCCFMLLLSGVSLTSDLIWSGRVRVTLTTNRWKEYGRILCVCCLSFCCVTTSLLISRVLLFHFDPYSFRPKYFSLDSVKSEVRLERQPCVHSLMFVQDERSGVSVLIYSLFLPFYSSWFLYSLLFIRKGSGMKPY